MQDCLIIREMKTFSYSRQDYRPSLAVATECYVNTTHSASFFDP